MHFSRYGRPLGLFISILLLMALAVAASLETNGAHASRFITTDDAAQLATNPVSENLELVGHIGGSTLAIAVHGQYAYIGEGSQVTVLSIADPEAPVVVGTSAPLPGIVQGISVSGEYAYVAAEWGVHIFDISEPTAPAEVGFFATPGVAKDVTVDDQYAYIADSSDSLLILDITNLEIPKLTGALVLVGGRSDHMGVDVRDGIAFVASGYGLKVVDVHDPANPVLTGDYAPYGSGAEALDIVVIGTHAYYLDMASLTIFDVADPIWPFETGQVQYFHNARALSVDGDYAYVADAGYGLYIIDISDHRNPLKIGTSSTPSLSGSHDVAVIAGYALTAGDHRGLHVYDVSDPTTPIEAAHYDSRGRPMNLDVESDHAYVTLGWDGLRVVDIENPEEPTEAGSFGYNGYDEFYALDVSGDYAYVAAKYGLYVLDISDPSVPKEVNSHWDGGNDVVAVDNYVYLARDDGGLTILDATDPSALVSVGHLNTEGTAVSVAVSGNFAYLTLRYFDGLTSSLTVVDISDPTTPRVAGAVDFEALAQQVASHGKHAYVAVSQGLRIIDVSSPDTPVVVRAYSIAGVTWDVTIGDDFVATSGSYGLNLIDASDPIAPLAVGHSETPGGGYGVKASGNLLYLADGDGGLLIERRTPTYSVSGRVTAQEGHPIQDAGVSTGYKQATTDINGVYTLAGLLPGTHVIRVAKDDHMFTPQSQTVTVPPSKEGVNFITTGAAPIVYLPSIIGP